MQPTDGMATTGLARLRYACVLAKEAVRGPGLLVSGTADAGAVDPRKVRGPHPTTDRLHRRCTAADAAPCGARSAHDLSVVLLPDGSSRIPLAAATSSAKLGSPFGRRPSTLLVAPAAGRYGQSYNSAAKANAPSTPPETARASRGPRPSEIAPAVPAVNETVPASAMTPTAPVATSSDGPVTGGLAPAQLTCVQDEVEGQCPLHPLPTDDGPPRAK